MCPKLRSTFTAIGTVRAVLMPDYLWTYYRVRMVFDLMRIFALFAAAGWLLKCGKRVQRFFLPSEQAEPGAAGT